MSHTSRTRLSIFILIFTFTTLATAQREFAYSVKIKVMPRSDYNVEQEVEKFLASVSEGDSLSSEQIEENRRLLRPQFARKRDGFIVSGKTVISTNSRGRYVETVIPDLASGKGKLVRYLVRDNLTFSSPLAPTEAAHVTNADTGNTLSGPSDLYFLARRAFSGNVTATKQTRNGVRQTIHVVENGRTIWIELDSGEKGKFPTSAETYMIAPSGTRVLMSRCRVTDSLSNGEPAAVEIERFSKGKSYQREEYRLIEARNAKQYTDKDIILVGQKVIDLRLGTDPSYQLSYTLEGDLPSTDDLKRMQRLQSSRGIESRLRDSSSSIATLIVGGLIIMVGIALYFRERRQS